VLGSLFILHCRFLAFFILAVLFENQYQIILKINPHVKSFDIYFQKVFL